MRHRVPVGLMVTLEDENDALVNPKPLEAAGATPFILPYCDRPATVESVLDIIGGLVLAGGRDVDPKFYHELPHPNLKETEPLRDPIELSLLKRALERGMPILGICRGIQTLNVAAGGTLVQDIPSLIQNEIGHSHPWESALDPENAQDHHPIEIDSSSLLFELVGSDSLVVNSYHHQSVKDLAPGFRVSARAPDGVIEGIESLGHPFVLGVQCHIELLWEKDPRWLGLYSAFVKASENHYGKLH